ncbi:hypothetical protein GE09DRAFT_1223961 [Coniochaeta sp. 2T2.1]|nr:hypothetical protein GE09DRAFT_1223961 [Coniochaeta sp. 2T2.1]
MDNTVIITARMQVVHLINLNVLFRNMAVSLVGAALIWLLLDRKSEVSTALCPTVSVD